MNILKNLSIRHKLILISFVPLIALLYFLQDLVTAELGRKAAMTQVYQELKEIEKISDVIHELQKERAITIDFLTSDDSRDRDKMFEQRDITNVAFSALNKIYREHKKNTDLIDGPDSLAKFRSNMATFPDNVNELKLTLLNEITETSRFSRNSDIKNLLETHLFLMYAKEYLSRIRSHLNTAISMGEIKGKEYGRFSSRKGQFDISLYKFKNVASGDLLDFFNKRFSASSVAYTLAFIDSTFNNPDYVEIGDSDLWFANSLDALNLFKEAEDFSLEGIRERAEIELEKITSSVITNLSLALFAIILMLVLVLFTIRGIITSISSVRNVAERLTNGDVEVAVDVSTKDEIGDLARSFNRMISVTTEYSLFADAIGNGDYNQVVNVRGANDVLGKALNTMKDNLQKLSKENEIRTWYLSGSSELNDVMRGEKELIDLAQNVINQLTTYLKAQIGAIYIRENGKLNLVGSYAFHLRKNNANSVAIGQGLVGQSALEKKVILFEDIPDNYIKINSGLGNIAPKNIIVNPLLYEGEVKGVIEIGSATGFSEMDLEFLKLASDNIAIALNAAQSRSRLKQLLEETQKQAEELETQQEELKQFNEELQEKTDLLEKSETELKAQQEELQQINEELEEKANLLEEQKQTLENAKMQIENKARELETTSKYKSEFLANMSHELRTPLNSILILSQILMENKTGTLGEKEIQYASNVYNSGTDLLNLINEILDLSKVEAGKMELNITDFKIGDIAKNIESMFSEVAKTESINFDVEVDSRMSGYNIRSDKQRIEQILKNLLSNAFKFSDEGGQIVLRINKAEAGVSFKKKQLNKLSDIIAFSVSDTGIGIPQEKLNVIFEAFQQVDGSTKRKYRGTGLGLSISRELANSLGGEIHLESKVDVGSTFTLYLPSEFSPSLVGSGSSQVVVNEGTAPDGSNANDTHKIKKVLAVDEQANDDRNDIIENDRIVLIMEDDQQFAETLLDFVHERHYKGIIAYQGNTGLSYARYYKPDAIILDMKLPVMNGTEVLKQLKMDPDLRHIPVQIISGYDLKNEGMSLGAFDFLKKPVTREGLWQTFDRIEDFVSRKVKRLLVVEDDKQHNNAVKELIGNGDVKCFSAYSGKEAFETMTKDSFDCVIIDLGLPDMSGFDLLEKIKENNELIKTPVIVYTGKDLTREESSRLDKLANAVVLKTAFSHERLLDETMLFLHRVESKLPKDKQLIIRQLHKSDEVLKNKKVLVVDDDIRNVYSLTNALEEEGMNCITAENGKEALKALQLEPNINMVLMDVMMPEMDGYETTKAIRKQEKYRKLPIIALTAKAMKGDREKCLAAGMSDYISKPLNIEQLLSLMRVWLYA